MSAVVALSTPYVIQCDVTKLREKVISPLLSLVCAILYHILFLSAKSTCKIFSAGKNLARLSLIDLTNTSQEKPSWYN